MWEFGQNDPKRYGTLLNDCLFSIFTTGVVTAGQNYVDWGTQNP